MGIKKQTLSANVAGQRTSKYTTIVNLYDCFLETGNGSCLNGLDLEKLFLNRTILPNLDLVHAGPSIAHKLWKMGVLSNEETYEHERVYKVRNLLHWYLVSALKQMNNCQLPTGSPSVYVSLLSNAQQCVFAQVHYHQATSMFFDTIKFEHDDVESVQLSANYRHSSYSHANYESWIGVRTFTVNDSVNNAFFALMLIVAGFISSLLPVGAGRYLSRPVKPAESCYRAEKDVRFDSGIGVMTIGDDFIVAKSGTENVGSTLSSGTVSNLSASKRSRKKTVVRTDLTKTMRMFLRSEIADS